MNRPPGVERAEIDPAKVREYLLSETHPVGRFKAAFFRSLGYSTEAWETLASDHEVHVRNNECAATGANAYGQKYEFLGTLVGPSGRSAFLVTVWIVLHGEDFPRFVTAYPGPKP